MDDLNEFNNYISDSVVYYKNSNGLTYEQLASYLNVSESFIKQVSSRSSNKHYNIYHLWELSLLFNIKIDQLLPPLHDYEAFLRIRPSLSKDEYRQFLNKYKSKEAGTYEK